MADVLEIPRNARKQMREDAKRLQAYNDRLATVRKLYALHRKGR